VRALIGRIERAERGLGPADGRHVWLPDPDSDGIVRHATTGETATPAEIRARGRRHILVQHVDAEDRGRS